ncbi:MAG TPA: hypothetical protein PKN48_00240 [Bacteroidales bacterium]|nr:hypothetical protein [Bacteroidales bacterium]
MDAKAKQIISKEELDLFLHELIESPTDSQVAPEQIASAAIAVISFMLEIHDRKFNFGPGTIEEAVWTILEKMISSERLGLLQAVKIRRILHPSKGTNCIYLDPEIFEVLKKEAQEMLDLYPDATDDKKYYWKAITRGELPSRIVVKLT